MKTKDERLEFSHDKEQGLIEIFDTITRRCISMTPNEVSQLYEYEQSLRHLTTDLDCISNEE